MDNMQFTVTSMRYRVGKGGGKGGGGKFDRFMGGTGPQRNLIPRISFCNSGSNETMQNNLKTVKATAFIFDKN